MPTRQHAGHSRAIASASSCVTSLRLLNLTNSSRDLMICGFFEIVKTVEPCEEKVCATVWSRPLMIVTTAITAVTPTMMPMSVSAVRNLFARRLAVATRNASQVAATRNKGLPQGCTKSTKTIEFVLLISAFLCSFVALPDSFVFFDLTVANRNDAMGTFGDVVLVSDDDDRVAFGVETLEKIHDLH